MRIREAAFGKIAKFDFLKTLETEIRQWRVIPTGLRIPFLVFTLKFATNQWYGNSHDQHLNLYTSDAFCPHT
jgi:hypothetical protein